MAKFRDCNFLLFSVIFMQRFLRNAVSESAGISRVGLLIPHGQINYKVFFLIFLDQFNKSGIFNGGFYFFCPKNSDFLGYFLFWVANTLFSVIFCFVLNLHNFSVYSYRGKFATLFYVYMCWTLHALLIHELSAPHDSSATCQIVATIHSATILIVPWGHTDDSLYTYFWRMIHFFFCLCLVLRSISIVHVEGITISLILVKIVMGQIEQVADLVV